jgi:hypothetical protein
MAKWLLMAAFLVAALGFGFKAFYPDAFTGWHFAAFMLTAAILPWVHLAFRKRS